MRVSDAEPRDVRWRPGCDVELAVVERRGVDDTRALGECPAAILAVGDR